ncbi:MAG: hypothetical protein GXC72_01165 [Chitinophagaceae bacterium]|nr:hypothetical protein [Chitinophagaceae bacterium]
MKKIFSLVAIVIAISASAFTAVKDQPQYYFIGTSENLFDPDMYVTDPPAGLCQEGNVVPCLIEVPEGFTDKEDWLEAAENSSIVFELGIKTTRL